MGRVKAKPNTIVRRVDTRQYWFSLPRPVHGGGDRAHRRGGPHGGPRPPAHHLFTCTADLGPAPAATADNPHPWPSIVPGTFRVLEYGR